MKFLDTARMGFKASRFRGKATEPLFAGSSSTWSLFGPRTSIDYKQEIGSPMDSSIVAPLMGWIVDAWQEAEPVVFRDKENGDDPDIERKHAVLDLLNRPNPFYSGRMLHEALIQDLKLDGTAFVQIISDRYGLPMEAYWLPTDTMRPEYNSNGTEWVRYWECTIGGQTKKVDPSELLIWREGVDRATGGRRGYSRFKACIADVFSDNEARNTVNTILRNRMQMGVVATPSERYYAEIVKAGVNPKEVGYNEATAKELEDKIAAKNTRDGRGSFNLFATPMTITEFGSVLDKLDSRVLRSIPEERTAAAFKVHPVVAMLGTGLQASSDKHNMEEASRISWLSGIVPLQNSFADLINEELLPLTETKTNGRFGFDRSQVLALQESSDAVATRLLSIWKEDGITHDELRVGIGKKADPARKGLYYSDIFAPAPEEDDDEDKPDDDDAKALKTTLSEKWRARTRQYAESNNGRAS